MNKSEFIGAMATDYGVSKKEADTAYSMVIDTIKKYVPKEEINLVGVGKFAMKHVDACERRNPKTGEPVQCEAKDVVKFNISKTFLK